MRLTLGEAKSKLWRYSSPSGPETPQVTEDINEAARKLSRNKLFAGAWQRLSLAVYDSQITLPRTAKTVHKAYDADGGKRIIHNAWFEFHENGYQVDVDVDFPASPGGDLLDYGSEWVTFRDPTANFTVRATTGGNEAATSKILIRGTLDGDVVFTTNGDGDQIEGVELTLAGASQTTSQEFTTITSIVKDVTVEPVKLYSVVSATPTLLATYDAGETTPAYRRYRVAESLDNGEIVTVLVKRRHIDAISDNDLIYPANLDALKSMMQAINFDRKYEPERAGQFEVKAHYYMDEEFKDYLGPHTEHMEVAQGFGLGDFQQVS